jgi:hypothetical protein
VPRSRRQAEPKPFEGRSQRVEVAPGNSSVIEVYRIHDIFVCIHFGSQLSD